MTLHRIVFLLAVALLASAPAHSQNSPAHAAQLEKDRLELQPFVLNMVILERAFQTVHGMTLAVEKDPELQEIMKKNELQDDEPTIDQMAAAVLLSPKLVAIVTAHGFTPRSFSMAETCILETRSAVVAVNDGEKLEDVLSRTHVNPANVKFMSENRGAIEVLAGKYDMNDDDD